MGPWTEGPWAQGRGPRDWARDQGTRARDQGTRAQCPGPRDQGPGPGPRGGVLFCDPFTNPTWGLPDTCMQVEHSEECQIWEEIMTLDSKQVRMAPLGLIFIQDGSRRLWDACWGLKLHWKINNTGSHVFSTFSSENIIKQMLLKHF